MDVIPLYSNDLLTDLDGAFGSFIPQPATPDQIMWYRLGQRSIVDKLKTVKRQMEEDQLVRTL